MMKFNFNKANGTKVTFIFEDIDYTNELLAYTKEKKLFIVIYHLMVKKKF